MKISELSRVSGTPVTTIKFYLREGLLPCGRATAPNQATYSEVHLERLDLVRTLREVAGLGIDTIRQVLDAMEHRGPGDIEFLEQALHAMDVVHQPSHEAGFDGEHGQEDLRHVMKEVDAYLTSIGWELEGHTSTKQMLVESVAAFRRLCAPGASLAEWADPYVQAIEPLARHEVEWTLAPLDENPAEVLKTAVVGVILGERLLVALRQIAHHVEARRFLERTRSAASTREESG